MTLHVNIRALSGLPPALDRRDDDLHDAKTYLHAHTSLRSFGLTDLFGTHRRVISSIDTFLTQVDVTFPVADASRLRAILQSYRDTDMRAAQRADAAVPKAKGITIGGGLTPAEERYGPSVFDDRLAPTESLVPPPDHHADMPYKPSWSDVFSPASLGRDFVWRTTSVLAGMGVLERPIDPLEALTDPFVGDWAGLLRCADVFDRLGTMLGATGDCVADAAVVVPTVWTGNVAGACELNLQVCTDTLRSGAIPLALLARTYRSVAKGVHDNANLMATLVTALLDQAIDGMLDEVSLGLLDFYDAGTQVRDFVRLVKNALRVANDLADLVAAGISAIDGASNRFGLLMSGKVMPDLPQRIPQIPMPKPVPNSGPTGRPGPGGTGHRSVPALRIPA
jgi:hypothetical protein